MKKAKNIIRNSDIFGYPIALNFNKKGNTHRTIPGGILSILYFAIFLSYFIYCCIKCAYNLQDIDNLVTTTQNLQELGQVSYKST